MRLLHVLSCLVFGSMAVGQEAITPVALRDQDYYRHSEGSAIELPDGRILLAWSRFAGASGNDNGKATIVAAESKDGGKTWSQPKELPVGEAGINIMQAAFVPVKDRLMLAFSVRDVGSSIKHAIESKDGGRTWSERRKLFDAGGPNDRAVRLASGRILMPSHRVSKQRIGEYDDMEVLVARSDDDGKSWKLSEVIPHVPHPIEQKPVDPRPVKISEPAVAELADGTLLMLARSSVGWLYRSVSKDGGETWTRLEPTKIASQVAPPYLHRCRDGRIALLWNPFVDEKSKALAEKRLEMNLPLVPQRRSRLAMMTSKDGQTWDKERVLAEDGKHGFCYPAVLSRADGQLLIFCSRSPNSISPCDLVMLGPVTP
jgi:sialidase-1